MLKSFFFIVVFISSVYANHLDQFAKQYGFERDYKSALEKAQKKSLVLFVVVSKKECGYCRRFERRTLAKEPVVTILQKKFVVVVVDKNLDASKYPQQKYATKFTPKGFFVDPKNEKIFYETYGYVQKEDFVQTLQKVWKKWEELQ
jgi:thioredoxin-related protein